MRKHLHYRDRELKFPRPGWPETFSICNQRMSPGYTTVDPAKVTCKRCLAAIKRDAVRRLQGKHMLEVGNESA